MVDLVLKCDWIWVRDAKYLFDGCGKIIPLEAKGMCSASKQLQWLGKWTKSIVYPFSGFLSIAKEKMFIVHNKYLWLDDTDFAY